MHIDIAQNIKAASISELDMLRDSADLDQTHQLVPVSQTSSPGVTS